MRKNIKQLALVKLILCALFIFSTTQAYANSICIEALENANHILYNYHILKNHPEIDNILNSTERKKRVLQIFTKKIDPYNIFITKELYDSFEHSIIQYNINSEAFCNLLEQYYTLAMENKNKILNTFLNPDNPAELINKIKDLVSKHKANPEKVERKSQEIIKNRAINEDESYWLLTSLVANIFETEKEYGSSDFNSLKAGTRALGRSLEKLNNEQLLSALLKSFLNSADQHTTYYDKYETILFNQMVQSSHQGIGAMLSYSHEGMRIVYMYEGGPTEKSGAFKVGDRVTSINGNTMAVSGSIQEAVTFIESQGPSVTLTVERNGKPLGDFKVIKGEVSNKAEMTTTEIYKKNNKLAYINFDTFYLPGVNLPGSADSFKAELEKESVKNSEGLIIDLRDNGGGSTYEVMAILGFFLGQGKTASLVDSDMNSEPLVSSTHVIYEKPVVVLVNEFSASGSELLAGNLKLYNRAIVVGSEQTYGKGTAQINQPTENGGQLKITAFSYHLADGKSPQYDGIKSDIILPNPIRSELSLERIANPLIKDLPLAENIIDSHPEKKWMTDTEKEGLINSLSMPIIPVSENSSQQDVQKEQALEILDQYVTIDKALSSGELALEP